MQFHFYKKMSRNVGLPPGSLVPHSNEAESQVKVSLIAYNENDFSEREVEKQEDFSELKNKDTVSWLNINSVHDIELIEKIGKEFGFHALVLEDIVNTVQRPKFENYEDYLFVVVKMITYDSAQKIVCTEQVSLLLADSLVVTFQEKEGDVFNIIRDRIRTAKGRIRQKGADYLVYSLIDAIVDHYFLVQEKIGDFFEELEDELLKNPSDATRNKINFLKKEIIFFRKSVWPLREVISGLDADESGLIQEGTRKYLRDVYDHTIQVADTVETFRDIVSGMLDLYLTSISNKMNEVMKVLTIMASLFIPVTFIAGVYGMNFENMPELKLPFGYSAVWVVFVVVIAGMLVYFKRKRWI